MRGEPGCQRLQFSHGQPSEQGFLDAPQHCRKLGIEAGLEGLEKDVQLLLLLLAQRNTAQIVISMPSWAVRMFREPPPSCSPCHCALRAIPKIFRSS
jgi:hypothetical protein